MLTTLSGASDRFVTLPSVLQSIVLGLGWTVLVGLYAVASIIRGVSSFPECADADAELDRVWVCFHCHA